MEGGDGRREALDWMILLQERPDDGEASPRGARSIDSFAFGSRIAQYLDPDGLVIGVSEERRGR